MPDGVFAVGDFTALGGMQAIKEANRQIPEETAIIGFANEPFGKKIIPSLSTVNQQTVRMGEDGARLFFDSLNITNPNHYSHAIGAGARFDFAVNRAKKRFDLNKQPN